jgi:hypothetical protein
MQAVKAIGCLLMALVVGCNSEMDPSDALAKANGTNIQRLTNLYLAYQTENSWNGPPDEAKLKDFIRSIDPAKLKRVGVDAASIDAIFVSERDSQPFKVRYGVKGNVMGSTEPVVFEATGVDGKRQVGSLDMQRREVDAAEYDQLWSGKGVSPAPMRK